MVKNQKASLTLPSFMSRCKAALKEQMPNGCHMMQQLKGPTYIFSRLTHGTPRTFHANTKAGVISFVVLPPTPVSWVFIMAPALCYSPEIRQLHSRTIPH